MNIENYKSTENYSKIKRGSFRLILITALPIFFALLLWGRETDLIEAITTTILLMIPSFVYLICVVMHKSRLSVWTGFLGLFLVIFSYVFYALGGYFLSQHPEIIEKYSINVYIIHRYLTFIFFVWLTLALIFEAIESVKIEQPFSGSVIASLFSVTIVYSILAVNIFFTNIQTLNETIALIAPQFIVLYLITRLTKVSFISKSAAVISVAGLVFSALSFLVGRVPGPGFGSPLLVVLLLMWPAIGLLVVVWIFKILRAAYKNNVKSSL